MAKELMHLCTWFHANFLSLNPNKSCYIIFTGPRIIIPDDLNFEILIESYPIKEYLMSHFWESYWMSISLGVSILI